MYKLLLSLTRCVIVTEQTVYFLVLSVNGNSQMHQAIFFAVNGLSEYAEMVVIKWIIFLN